MPDRQTVIDSSALLALAKGEPGADAAVPRHLARGLLTAVGLAEFVAVMRRTGDDPGPYVSSFEEAGMAVLAADRQTAWMAGELERSTKLFGLSLGDRFCLALALLRGAPVLTTDRIWRELGLDIEIILAR